MSPPGPARPGCGSGLAVQRAPGPPSTVTMGGSPQGTPGALRPRSRSCPARLLEKLLGMAKSICWHSWGIGSPAGLTRHETRRNSEAKHSSFPSPVSRGPRWWGTGWQSRPGAGSPPWVGDPSEDSPSGVRRDMVSWPGTRQTRLQAAAETLLRGTHLQTFPEANIALLLP